MKRPLTILLATLLLACVAPPAPAARAQGRTTPPARRRKTRADDHPKIREAIAALEAAKTELEQTEGDFGGHKAEAVEAVNNALKRLRLALQFDKY
ncbi:MAG TPA: hypothetical protein VHU19_18010 [Pyrinomonadaceae bacterium]|jgi:hypothetical protein|nr:hypothetical protein [Pyrinomonadaceae bacterium]